MQRTQPVIHLFNLADTRSERSILGDGGAALRYANVPLTR